MSLRPSFGRVTATGLVFIAFSNAKAEQFTLPDQVLMKSLDEAYSLIEAGKPERARDRYQTIVERFPDEPSVLSAARFGSLFTLLEEVSAGFADAARSKIRFARLAIDQERRKGALTGTHVDFAISLADEALGQKDKAAQRMRQVIEDDAEYARLDSRRTFVAAPEPDGLESPPAPDLGPQSGEQTPLIETLESPMTVWVSREANIRSAPRLSPETLIGKLPRRTKIIMTGRVAGTSPWREIRVNGRRAFIHVNLLSISDPGPAPAVVRKKPQAPANTSTASTPRPAAPETETSPVPVPTPAAQGDEPPKRVNRFLDSGAGERGGGGGGGGGGRE